jgi:hypothetical protein
MEKKIFLFTHFSKSEVLNTFMQSNTIKGCHDIIRSIDSEYNIINFSLVMYNIDSELHAYYSVNSGRCCNSLSFPKINQYEDIIYDNINTIECFDITTDYKFLQKLLSKILSENFNFNDIINHIHAINTNS